VGALTVAVLLSPLGGCGGKDGGGGRSAQIGAALKQAHQASVNAAEVTECALTAVATASVDRKVVVFKVDAAEVATRAATRALENALGLYQTCRDRWDPACDYKAATVTAMLSSTKDAHEGACAARAAPSSPDAAPGH
jgi:hypothetical protein